MGFCVIALDKAIFSAEHRGERCGRRAMFEGINSCFSMILALLRSNELSFLRVTEVPAGRNSSISRIERD
jgi:hypothetical protein